MLIEVKGVNDILMMKIDENCSFEKIINELDMLLDQPIFINDRYYPRAYFDFGCRILNENELYCLVTLLYNKKRILLQGISLPKKKRTIRLYYQALHNGEETYINEDTLFLSVVHAGSYIYLESNVYFLNVVQGHIISRNSNIVIYGQQFQNATIMINDAIIHHLTTSALTSVYYKDGHIVLKEDEYEQNYSHYIR